MLLFGAAAAVALSMLASQPAAAQSPTPASAAKVVVSGTVPDEATRAAILAKVREVYGAERVLDQLGVGPIAAPPNWSAQVQKLITPELKRVSQGQLRIEGNVVELVGNVASDAQRQQMLGQMVAALGNPTYTVRNGLRAGHADQAQLDAALATRTIEFEPGNAQLTSAGMRVLDELLPLLLKFSGRRFEIVGHTDAEGVREQNLALSRARAESVKAYLAERGIAPASMVTAGAGPDRPVAANSSAEGRARNRRIEFRVLA